MTFHIGSMEEMGGWFTSLDVEYIDKNDAWRKIDDIKIIPPLIEGEKPFNKPHFVEYLITFKPVTTRAIRIIGNAGGLQWYRPKVYFTSITELSVYKQ